MPLISNEKTIIKLSNTISTDGGNLYVIGKVGSGKTTLLDNIKMQLDNKGVFVDYIKFNNKSVDWDDQLTRVLADKLQKYCNEITERTKLLKEKQVSNIYDIKDEKIEPKVIIIDDFNTFMSSSDYKTVDSIKHSIDSALKFSKIVGFTFVFTASSIICSRFTKAMMADLNNGNFISLDDVKAEYNKELFDSNSFKLNLGTGLYIYKQKNPILFATDTVKYL